MCFLAVLFIFNPDTDYALAAGRHHYNPPRGVVAMTRCLAPAVLPLASSGDFFLMPDCNGDISAETAIRKECRNRGIDVITSDQLGDVTSSQCRGFISPWGWNHSLRDFMITHGVAAEILPSESEIDDIRNLAHRHNTIEFNRLLNESLETDSPVPLEFHDVDKAIDYLCDNPDSYIKSPWSSSGRGVAPVAGMKHETLVSRVNATIRKQGSILVENAAEKILDFATEWHMTEGHARFLGISVFDTRMTGEYNGNRIAPQHELEEMIRMVSGKWSKAYIDAQQEALETLVAPLYEGPAGIDMLVDSAGDIRPCIEINMRHTMGHVAIAIR